MKIPVYFFLHVFICHNNATYIPILRKFRTHVVLTTDCQLVAGLNSEMLAQHIKSKGRPTCNDCGKTFASRKSLTRHQQLHIGYRLFTCNVCRKTFTSRGNLTRHQQLHSGYKPFSCDVCGKAFVNKYYMAYHRLTHTGERPHRCDICGKTFARRSTMTNHRLLVHCGPGDQPQRHRLVHCPD